MSEKLIASNRRAGFEYHLEQRFEAGLVLTGTEVKSLRQGKGNLQDAWCDFDGDGLVLKGLHIAPYERGGYVNHEPTRPRRLLLRGEEIAKLQKGVASKGYTIVPTKIYFSGQWAKVEIALAKGKQLHDKRDTIAERDNKRALDRIKKGRRDEE